MLRAATLIVLLCLSACATGTVLQPARVLPRTATAVTVAAEGVNSPRAPANEQWLPQPELMVRHGERDDLDFGFRVWPFSVELDAKYELLRSRWFDAAINPGAAIHWSLGAAIIELEPRAIVDLNLIGEPYQLHSLTVVVSGSPMGRCYAIQSREGGGCYVAQAASAGLHFQATDDVAVFAEASRTWPVLIRQTTEFKLYADTIQFAAGLSLRWEKAPTPAPKGPVHPFEEVPVDGGSPP